MLNKKHYFKTELEFVDWYVDKYFYFFGDKVCYKYLHHEESMNVYKFIEIVKYNIGNNLKLEVDFNDYLFGLVKSSRDKTEKDIIDFLKFKYKVKLGIRSWDIVTFSGNIVTIDDVCSTYKQGLNVEFVKSVVEKWFENEIISSAEKIILNFD
jgi:hypothetical protein